MDPLAAIKARRQARLEGHMNTDRKCGDCTLCCSAIPIAEFDKPPGVPCENLGTCGGCAIYDKRPHVCREFYCVWRHSDHWLPTWAKPDRVGWLLSFNNPLVWPSVVTVHVDPARPDAWRTIWAQTIFRTLAENWNCMVAIGSAPWVKAVVCPNGGYLDIEKNPSIQTPEGFVGAPDYMFSDDRRPLIARMAETRFVWQIKEPPL